VLLYVQYVLPHGHHTRILFSDGRKGAPHSILASCLRPCYCTSVQLAEVQSVSRHDGLIDWNLDVLASRRQPAAYMEETTPESRPAPGRGPAGSPFAWSAGTNERRAQSSILPVLCTLRHAKRRARVYVRVRAMNGGVTPAQCARCTDTYTATYPRSSGLNSRRRDSRSWLLLTTDSITLTTMSVFFFLRMILTL
jgi:hypothetical protein